LEQAATTDVYLIKAHKGAQIGHIVHKWEDITTAPRMIVNLPPILNTVFPTYDNNASVDYYILWDREKAGIVSPMDNKVSCGCGDKDSKIQQFVIPYGVNFQNLHSINTPGNKTEYANGVILDVEMTCGTSQFFCREFDEKDEIAIAVASAVQYYAASGLLDRVLTTPNINRFTMENNQTLENMRAEYISEFKKLIQFIQNVADITGTDCFICKSSITDINITGIIS
jgi:hypothetical protein